MSRTVAPLLSFDARGQLGKTLVYSTWKGRPYARRYVVPANPQTTEQTTTRNAWRGLNRLFAYLPSSALGAWTLYGDNSRITARNGFLKLNLAAGRAATDLTAILLSPAAGGGLQAAQLTLTPGASQITADLVAPTLPEGWTIAEAVAVAVADHDPHDLVTPDTAAGTDATDPYSIVLTGLTTGTDYLVGAWFRFTKPDGSAAYGAAVQNIATAA